MRVERLAIVLTTFLFAAGASFGAESWIGMVSSQGTMTIDNAGVEANSTLFDGSTVEAKDYSRLRLNNGTRVDLGSGSRAKVFAGRETLESGMTEVQSPSGYEIDARTLKILPGPTSTVRVKIDGEKAVYVTALNAPVNVLNQQGLAVARVLPGTPFAFMPQAAGAPTDNSTDITGCFLERQNVLLLTDVTGTQVYEVRRGKHVALDSSVVGNRYHVVGVIDSSATPDPKGGASQVLVVGNRKLVQKGGCTDAAAKSGAAAVATAAIAVPVATGAVVAAASAAAAGAGIAVAAVALPVVIGGVAAAAAVGGVAAAVASGGHTSTSP